MNKLKIPSTSVSVFLSDYVMGFSFQRLPATACKRSIKFRVKFDGFNNSDRFREKLLVPFLEVRLRFARPTAVIKITYS